MFINALKIAFAAALAYASIPILIITTIILFCLFIYALCFIGCYITDWYKYSINWVKKFIKKMNKYKIKRR